MKNKLELEERRRSCREVVELELLHQGLLACDSAVLGGVLSHLFRLDSLGNDHVQFAKSLASVHQQRSVNIN